jgi:hypothetical protein
MYVQSGGGFQAKYGLLGKSGQKREPDTIPAHLRRLVAASCRMHQPSDSHSCLQMPGGSSNPSAGDAVMQC